MKKTFLMMFVSTLCLPGTVLADLVQNEAFDVPEIGSVTIDGDLSDWATSTAWSDDFILWNDAGAPLSSTTKAKFAWNNTDDMLYVAVETNQTNGGHLIVGVGITADGVPHDGIGTTQLAFDAGIGTDVEIMNEIAYYGEIYYPTSWAVGSGIDGVEASQTNDGSTWTYEIAIPYWTDWQVMDTKHTISSGDAFYAYIVMEDVLGGGNGTNMTFDGNPNFAVGPMENTSSLLTFVPPAAGDANRDGKVDGSDVTILAGNWQAGVAGSGGVTWDMGDFNGDGKVDGSDVTILAGNWQSGVTAAAASVPEPGTLALLLGAIINLFAGRRTQRSY